MEPQGATLLDSIGDQSGFERCRAPGAIHNHLCAWQIAPRQPVCRVEKSDKEFEVGSHGKILAVRADPALHIGLDEERRMRRSKPFGQLAGIEIAGAIVAADAPGRRGAHKSDITEDKVGILSLKDL